MCVRVCGKKGGERKRRFSHFYMMENPLARFSSLMPRVKTKKGGNTCEGNKERREE